jgi:hypothetical protein
MALAEYHCRVQPGGLSLCPVSDDVLELARQHLQDLALPEERMWTALTRISLSLKDAAIFVQSAGFYIAY